MQRSASPDGPILACQNCGARTPYGIACDACGWSPPEQDGVLDFVRDPAHAAEREFYDEAQPKTGTVGLDGLRWLWTNPYYPANQRVRAMVGDIRGKRVLTL